MFTVEPYSWRKGLVLSATFLFSLFVIFACKKKVNPLGETTINPNELLQSGGIDTFSLTTFTYKDDTIISDNAPFAILGSYNDPVFASFNSEIYTQFRLSGLSPDFGALSSIIVDSFVLGLNYVGYYGNAGVQNIEVYELLNDLHIDSTYYSFSTPATNTLNLVQPGMGSIDLNSQNITVIGQETVDSQLRVHLSTSKAKQLMIEAESASGSFDDNDAFLNFFKGLHIKTNNMGQLPGEGGVFYFNLNDPMSKLTIYYTKNGEQNSFDFLINTSCADFNHVDVINTGTSVETVINDTVSGQSQFYAQSFGGRAVVKIPGLDNIPRNAVIHTAILDLPVQYQTNTNYAPGLDVSVTARLEQGSTALYSINTIGSYSDYRKSFEIDLRGYIQDVVSGKLNNTDLIFSPLLHNTAADRIIFNGPATLNKVQPKLTILYTEF
jgi:hypothetical protein